MQSCVDSHVGLKIQPEAAESTPEPEGKILIVDDDQALVDVLSLRLNRLGFETVATNYGQETLELARSQRPRLILLDLRLPDVEGFEVCQQLADDPETCLIPIIILSGMERPDIVRRSRSAGCQYFVHKPYDPNALLLLIRDAIRNAGSDDWLDG